MPRSKPTPDRPDRALLELAPLIYVAWSDGLLTHEELERVRARFGGQGASPQVERILREWLDPDKPPPPAKLYALLEMMRSAHRKSKRKFRSLSEFARFLGGRAGKQDEETTPELTALREIEDALGIAGDAALRVILGGPADAEPVRGMHRLDAEELTQFIDGERLDIRRLVFNLLNRSVFDRTGIDDITEYRDRVLKWCRELGRLGVSAYGYPQHCDGENNLPKSIAAFETLAYHDMSLLVKFGVQFGLFGGSVLQLGTRKHHDKYLRDIASLELPGCFAMTETGHGSNVRDLQTIASYDIANRTFVIDTPSRAAWKDYIGNAALHARMATVFAQLEVNGEQHGVHAFLVPLRDENGRVLPGITIEDCGRKIGLNGVDNGRICFDSVRIPRENLLDRFGSVTEDGRYTSPISSASKRFFTMIGTLVAGRISIAAASCSAAKLGLTIAGRYATRRAQFGPEGKAEVPIINYRSIQRTLMPLIARTYALDFAIHDTYRKFDRPIGEDRNVEMRAAALKAAASRHAATALQYSRELCAGQGYMWYSRIGELRADTDIFTTFEGANNVLLQLVARGLLTELREQFEEMPVWAVVRQITTRAGTALTELNPIITRKADDAHLLDPEFHGNAFKYREDRLRVTVAQRLRRLISEGVDPFDAANRCQDHLIRLGEAYGERIAFESFRSRLERAKDVGVRYAMTRLCALYALSSIENDRAWFLESGYIEPAKSKAIRTMTTELCTELSEHVTMLLNGWGIPEKYLPAIAK